MKKKHKKRNSGKNSRNCNHNSNTIQNTQNTTGCVHLNNDNNDDNGTNSTDANIQSIVTPSVLPPVLQPEIPQPVVTKEGIPPLQSIKPKGNKKPTKSPKRKRKWLSSIKCNIKRFFNKIKKGLSAFGNNILRKPKKP